MRVVSYSFFSHQGHRRQKNEDSYLVSPTKGLFAIADGMGGRPAGEVASFMALKELDRLICPTWQRASVNVVLPLLKDAIHRVNQHMRKQIRENPRLLGCGTTLCALYTGCYDGALLINLGDSSAFLFRSMFENPIRITADRPRTIKENGRDVHYINGLGIWENIEHMEAFTIQPPLGTRILLCTDGISDYHHPETLKRFAGAKTTGDMLDALCKNVLNGPAHDNLTGVLVEINPI